MCPPELQTGQLVLEQTFEVLRVYSLYLFGCDDTCYHRHVFEHLLRLRTGNHHFRQVVFGHIERNIEIEVFGYVYFERLGLVVLMRYPQTVATAVEFQIKRSSHTSRYSNIGTNHSYLCISNGLFIDIFYCPRNNIFFHFRVCINNNVAEH